jgi:hypothetical protein
MDFRVEFQYQDGSIGYQDVRGVNNQLTAQNFVKSNPGVLRVRNCLPIHDDYNSNKRSNSSDDSSDGTSNVYLLALMAGATFTAATMPWSTMLIGGTIGAWVASKITGTTLEDAIDDNRNFAISFILISSLALGGFGFVKGGELKRELNIPSVPEMLNNKN